MDQAPTVSTLHVSPARHAPMRAVGSVVAEAGAGLVGDRYHGSRHRHVSVQSEAELALASSDLGRPLTGPITGLGTRRNVTLSSGTVPTTPGHRIRIGEVELELVRVAAPCRVLEDSVGPGARAALRRRAGSIFRILSGGTITLGDTVDLDAGAPVPSPAVDGLLPGPSA